jgi:hypothetical protein
VKDKLYQEIQQGIIKLKVYLYKRILQRVCKAINIYCICARAEYWEIKAQTFTVIMWIIYILQNNNSK